jgi:exosome complex RNA-binding protein Rrp4
VLLAANAEGDNLAAKVYIINKSTDASLYVTITINAQTIGKLYGGDFMFIPWSQTDTSASIEIAATNWTSSTGDIPVEYALFHEDTDFLTNA